MESHAKLKIRTYVQDRTFFPDLAWHNVSGLTETNLKYQTTFISDQRGFANCTPVPSPSFHEYRVVIDFFNVYNSSGKHITVHEIFDGWNDNHFGSDCLPH
jgi:hypothetical protein